MATTYYEAQERYALKSQNALSISVEIGDGQGGGYLIFNGTQMIAANETARIENNNQISEWITLTATIKDKLTETNWTSVTLRLKEDGQQETAFGPYSREVENHLDTVVYTIKIKTCR